MSYLENSSARASPLTNPLASSPSHKWRTADLQSSDKVKCVEDKRKPQSFMKAAAGSGSGFSHWHCLTSRAMLYG